MELFRQIRRLAGRRQRGVGEAQDPFDVATHHTGANPGIMAAKQQAVRAMRLDIVKPPAGCAMLAAWGGLAAVQAGGPGSVMRLQAQPAIGGRRGGQREQFLRERSSGCHIPSPGDALPLTVNRYDKLAVVVAPLGEFARPRVGSRRRLRDEAFGEEQRQAARQLQFDFLRIPGRTFRQ